MSILLLRDSTIFLSTVDITSTTPTASNTTKVSVLGDFLMTQSNVIESYSTFRQSESPNRVKVKYVKDFNFVNLEFSTYSKVKQVAGLAEPADLLLWKALTNSGITKTSTYCTVDFLSSKTNTFPDLYIYVNTGSVVFKVGKCYIEGVTLEIDINNIIKANWVIKAMEYSKIDGEPSAYLDRTELSNYMIGRYSSVYFYRNQEYTMPLLSGKIEISQDVTRLSTPVVGQAIATNSRARVGEREVKGEIGTYLRVGGGRSLALLESMLNALSEINDTANIILYFGKKTDTHIEVSLPLCIVDLPKINTKDVFTVDMELIPLESATGENDDITIKFYV